ncbi:hypothetical protein AB0M02_32870 [Actinoplanes sp. NPDC051861]|uniref:phage late control D family protein n=1 Tax=Actinoplanes sp. NPDC051861 TaxID=3155170 RepID=UPI00342F1A08
MTAAVSIAAGRDFYVPAFEVRMLAGGKLPREVQRDVLQVTFRDGLDTIPQVDLTINNWDVAKRAFKYSDSDLFDPGKELTVAMGYHGGTPLTTMINARIVTCRASFPSSGAPALTVGAQSILMRKLQREKKPGPYETEETDEAIAAVIAQRVNVPVRTDQSARAGKIKISPVMQGNESTLAFLLERARRIDYEVLVDELGGGKSRLYFGPTSGVATVVHRLAYGSTLSEFQPALDTLDQVGKVVVNAWDGVTKAALTGRAERSQVRLTTAGSAAAQRAAEDSFGDREEIVSDASVKTQEEADQRALAVLRENAKKMLTATGSVVGLPGLRAGAVVEIDKVGSRFRGRYVLTSTTHTIGGGGYTTGFECRHE